MAEKVIRFIVPGEPKAQPRLRHRIVTPKRGKAFASGYTPATASGFKERVYLEAKRFAAEVPHRGAVRLECYFYFTRPKSLERKSSPEWVIPHLTKPDTDNVIKAVKDALTGLLWNDDKQVYNEHAVKLYHVKGGAAHSEIVVYFEGE